MKTALSQTGFHKMAAIQELYILMYCKYTVLLRNTRSPLPILAVINKHKFYTLDLEKDFEEPGEKELL